MIEGIYIILINDITGYFLIDKEKVNVDPLPNVLVTKISSFIAFKISFAIESPRPVPSVPYLALLVL